MTSPGTKSAAAIPLGRWKGLGLALHLSWVPILLVLALMVQGPAHDRGMAVIGALAGAAIHAAMVTMVLRQRGRRANELVITPYGVAPQWAGQSLIAGGGVWISIIIAGILVRLACAMICHGLAVSDGSAGSRVASPWLALQQWNLLLAWLHPLPAIPLDGSRALRAWTGFILPSPITDSILRRAGLVCAFLLLLWSLWGDIHVPALLTAVFLWHAAEFATRAPRSPAGTESTGVGWNPDEIVVSPPPYARKKEGSSATTAAVRKSAREGVRDFIAGFWTGCS